MKITIELTLPSGKVTSEVAIPANAGPEDVNRCINEAVTDLRLKAHVP